MISRCLSALASVLVAASLGATYAQEVRPQAILITAKATESRHVPESFQISPEVVVDESGETRLAKSMLLTDEVGATDQHQSEALGGEVLVKKLFMLPGGVSLSQSNAQLLFFGQAGSVQVNGVPLDKVEKLPSTGWKTATVPAKLLKPGENAFVFSGKGSLLVEPGRRGRSFKSSDGGKTWSNQGLTTKGDVEGEYLVRLRIPLHAAEGWAQTQALDLWGGSSKHVPGPRLVHGFKAPSLPEQPKGTSITTFVRTGSTPHVADKTWTGWLPLASDVNLAEAARSQRWAQWKFVLRTERGDATPLLPAAMRLEYQAAEVEAANDELVVENMPAVPVRSVPFVYQTPSKKLEHLRQRYKLDEVIAPGKTEMEQLMLLRYWVRNQWHTAWQGGASSWMPPWDALIILECKDQPECLTMCTHYAAVYTQCCQALGWNARHCILDHHCVSEVFVRDVGKWVMMDPGNSAKRADVGLHYESQSSLDKEGAFEPMSARELHLASKHGALERVRVCFTPRALSDKIAHLCRPAPAGKNDPKRPDVIPASQLKDYPLCQIENFRRYGFPARNNFLTTLLPGELYQGLTSYFYDGYWWVGDDRDRPTISPEYTKLLDPKRAHDIDWPLDSTLVHLSRTAKSGELRVDLEALTPNFKQHEVRAAKGEWQKTPASFTWKLTPGANELHVRGVNHWNKPGMPARVQVTWRK